MMEPSDALLGDKYTLLRNLEFCEDLPERQIKFLAAHSRLVEFNRGDFIYRQGEVASSFYIILSGRVGVIRHEETHSSVLSYLYHGDYFGEVALLTEDTYATSARAMNDTALLVLSKDVFAALLERIPSLAFRISRSLSRRFRQRLEAKGHVSQIIAVHSAVPGTGNTTFAIALADRLAQESRCRPLLIDLTRHGDHISALLGCERKPPLAAPGARGDLLLSDIANNITHLPEGFDLLNIGYAAENDLTSRMIARLLSHLAERHRFLIVDLATGEGGTAVHVLSQSDAIFVLTKGDSEALGRTAELLNTMRDSIDNMEERVRVIVNGQPRGNEPAAAVIPYPTAISLPNEELLTGADSPQNKIRKLLRAPSAAYMQRVRRLARRITGVQIGLALGSGAALGLAHIGVLKVLEREAIPIDLLAGTSIGALLGSAWAVGHSADSLERVACEFTGRRATWNLLVDMAFPWTGLIRGKKVTTLLQRLLGDRTFNDTELPLHVIATHLRTGKETVFQQGLIADAVRASISIAGIFQPAQVNGRLYLDGGIVNPVPVMTLRRAGATKVIAVSVLPSPEDIAQREEERSMAFQRRQELARKQGQWALLRFQLLQRLRDTLTTNVFDVIMQAMQAMQYEIAETTCQRADLLLRPTIPHGNWLAYYHAKRFIDRGEQAAERMLPQIKQLLAEQESV